MLNLKIKLRGNKERVYLSRIFLELHHSRAAGSVEVFLTVKGLARANLVSSS